MSVLTNIATIGNNLLNKASGGILGSWGYEAMLTTPIDSYCLTEMGDWQLMKNMFMNTNEKNITLDLVADSTTGISNKVSDEIYKYYYSYVQGNNYVDDYQKDAKKTSTRSTTYTSNVGARHQYEINKNLYPDEDNTGNDNFFNENKWDFYNENKNKNSIINKTKQLFNERKINTIISRFHTDPDNLDLYDGRDAGSQYGLSHGRNLLTYDAENGVSYDTNGYDNPYCRVWTHHHQYSQRRARLMRPFTVEDRENGTYNYRANQNLHKWDNFGDFEYVSTDSYETVVEKDDNKETIHHDAVKRKWSWKDKGADDWVKSVFDQETGLINIAPKFLGGDEKNIHTKDCMFSIENLAWQGYDPYSFERALSWEQRGPFGGRIMWFPPYGLRFNEDTSVNWNEHSFIGRGENVFTYTNTSRSGTLEFMMVVDHPSILDYSTWYGQSQPDKLPEDNDVYRFFAGCDGGGADGKSGGLSSYARPTPLTDEYIKKDITEETIPTTEEVTPEPQVESQEETPTPDEEIKVTFFVFYPNNYSGYYDRTNPDSVVDPIAYLLCGTNSQWRKPVDSKNLTNNKSVSIDFNKLSEYQFRGRGVGYEMSSGNGVTSIGDDFTDCIIGTKSWSLYGKGTNYIPDTNKKWYYRIDGEYKVAKGKSEIYQNTFDQLLINKGNNIDEASGKQLNSNSENVKTLWGDFDGKDKLYSMAEVAYVLLDNFENEDETPGQTVIKEKAGWGNDKKKEERMKELIEMLNPNSETYKVVDIRGVGYASSHGNNPKGSVNYERNKFLAQERLKTAIDWFKKNYGNGTVTIESGKEDDFEIGKVSQQDLTNVNGLTAKKWRSAKVELKIRKSSVKKPQEMNNKQESGDETIIVTIDKMNELLGKYPTLAGKFTVVGYKYTGNDMRPEYLTVKEFEAKSNDILDNDFNEEDYLEYEYSIKKSDILDAQQDESSEEGADDIIDFEPNGYNVFEGFEKVEIDNRTGIQLYINLQETEPDKRGRKWYYDRDSKQMKLFTENILRNSYTGEKGSVSEGENNSLRYDQEYHFFKKLKAEHEDVFDSLVKKLQYFDPAFHSMTPEGFMGRLNFLHQCTRQGNTISASDKDGRSANNLAFGRPPFCILRLGDFYYQKIVIRNINITYDPLVLDLNNEGIGVVPLIANVTISFNFIGGGDLSGPVRRLQNAMSFNYYANGRLYDNRADRVERERTNWETMGAMGNDKVDFGSSYFHNVKMSK